MLSETTVFRAAFWSSLTVIFQTITHFLIIVILAAKGPVNLAIFYLGLRVFHTVALFLVRLLAIRYTPKLRESLNTTDSIKFDELAAYLIKVYFLFGLAGAALVAVILVGVASWFKIESLIPFLIIFALSVPFTLLEILSFNILRLMQRFKKLLAINLLISLLQLMLIYLLVGVLNFALITAGISYLVVAIFSAFLGLRGIFNAINLLGLLKKVRLRQLKFSRLALLNVFSVTFLSIIDLLLIVWMLGLDQLGFYVTLFHLPYLMHIIPASLFGMFLHVAITKIKKREDINHLSDQVITAILILTLPVLAIIILFPEQILSTVYGKEYITRYQVMQLLATAFFIQSIAWMAGRILIARDRIKEYVATNFLYGSLLMLLIVLLMPDLRLMGVGVAFLVASFVDLVIKYSLVVSMTKVVFLRLKQLKILLAGLISLILCQIIFQNQILVFIGYLIFFIASLLIFQVFGKKDLTSLKLLASKEVQLKELAGEYE